MNPQPLFYADGTQSKVFFCEKCRTVGTKEFIDSCCDPKCRGCGEPVRGPYYTTCDKCWKLEEEKREVAMRAKATVMESWDGWVMCEGYGYREGYFESLDDLLLELEECAGDEGHIRPTYAYVCEARPIVCVSLDSIMDGFEFPEGMDEHDLYGEVEFQAAIDAFEKANENVVSYWQDSSRVVLIPPLEKS